MKINEEKRKIMIDKTIDLWKQNHCKSESDNYFWTL